MWLFLAFLAVPLIEIALFIQIGGFIGLWPTLLIVVLTAVLGTWLVRAQGRLAMGELRQSFSELNDPSEPLAHGAMILVSGALLLTPGFFTDTVGFALLAPPIRRAVFQWAKKRVNVQRFEMGSGPGAAPRTPGARPGVNSGPSEGGRREDTVIDGEFIDLSDDKKANHPGSGWTRH